MKIFRLHDAAERIGVSYPTLKQWIYQGKIQSVQTAGGHHRIPATEIERFLGARQKTTAQKATVAPPDLDHISGRNKLFGTVTAIKFAGLLAQITVDVGGQLMTSIITADSARSLDLKKGALVYALVKATEVMIIRGSKAD